MAKKRKYSTRKVSLKMSYTVQEVSELFDLHKNAVLSWIKAGLKIIDQKKPYLINGGDLVEFLTSRQKKRKHKCKPNELFCFKCRLPRKPKSGSALITQRNTRRLKISANCEDCETKMFKADSFKNLKELEKIYQIVMQQPEHIVGCNNTSINSDMSESDNHEQIQS